jgi:sugar phosphate isomerase/epimerase
MDIKVFCPLWGHEHENITDFVARVRNAGFDGLECGIPLDPSAKKELLDALSKQELLFISQQHQAEGSDFQEYKESFVKYLHHNLDGNPILINSHTGTDYFTFEQNLALIDITQDFEAKTGTKVTHETHRRRFTYAPMAIQPYFEARKEWTITADFSHWVCVSENYLEPFSVTMEEAFRRTVHIHARVGYQEGPQVPDPRAPEWAEAVDKHLQWWKRIVQARRAEGAALLTVTAEFGPPPYMPILPFTRKPVADQFEVNRYMKDLVKRELA